MKKIERVYTANQSWYYEAIHKINNRLVRIQIRRNAYDEQSHSHAYLFDGDKWHLVVNHPSDHMKCLDISYVQKDVSAEKFYEDELGLLEEVNILTGDQ